MSLCKFAFPFAFRLPFGLPSLPRLPSLPSVSISIPEMGLNLISLPRLPFGLPSLPSLPRLPSISFPDFGALLGIPGLSVPRIVVPRLPFGFPSLPHLSLPWITLPPCPLDGKG